MSHDHADKIAAIAAVSEKPAPPIDPRLYWRDDMRQILATHAIGALYQVLKDAGVTQRQIAELTGQSQSEVSEILAGRRVVDYDVLERIAEGLGIPRKLMGLSYGKYGAHGEQVTVADPFQALDTEKLRRHMLALGAIVAIGGPAVRELVAELGNRSPARMPSRLSEAHVAKVRDLTRRLREAGCTYGSDPEVSTAAAAWATRLLDVPGPETLRKALMTAVTELRIQAG